MFAGCQSHAVCFTSPFGQGERIKVRGSSPPGSTISLGATLTLPLSLAQGEATHVRAIRLNTNWQFTNATGETSSSRRAHLVSKGKMTFQSFFMLMTVQPFFFASS